MCDLDRHDDDLFSILRECRTLPAFLDAVFGFLSRRTDFYVISDGRDAQVGLPDGLAERLVRNAFYKWKPKDLSIEDNVPEAVVETEIADHCAQEDDRAKERTADASTRFAPSDSYNGAAHEDYCWSQTVSEVDVAVIIPPDATAKDISVAVLPSTLCVELKGEEGRVLLGGDLCQKCKHNDAIWSVDAVRGRLEVHLEKCYEMWWDCLLKGEPRLDVDAIDCSRPFEELSEEAQAKIQELTWNQERKRLGLPTSDELKMHETLRKAWSARGSPFNGPFNPAVVNFN